MDKVFLSTLALIVGLLLSIQYVRCDEIYIIPTPDSPCPGAITGQSCFTLQQYVANPSRSSNITLKLYPGIHRIDHFPLSVLKINRFTMTATKAASVTVVCGQQLPSGYYFWFTFTQVWKVNVSGITFDACKFGLAIDPTDTAANIAFVRSSFVNNTCCNRGGVIDITSALWQNVFVTIKQCVFSDNNLGAGSPLRTRGVNLTVDQSIFKNNSVLAAEFSQIDGGGAISHSYIGYLNILNSNFSNNEIASNFNGGAVYISQAGKSSITNCYFSGNIASGDGGAVYNFGGLVTLTNSTFTNNRVMSTGGHGGAVYARAVNITNSFFINNTAGSTNGNGGAVYVPTIVPGNTQNVTSSYFSNNAAGGRGGAIAFDMDSNITVSNTTFTNNTARVGGGGAIYCVGRYAAANISLLNSIFSNNTAAYCGAVDVDEFYHGSAKVVSSTFSHNRAAGQIAGSNGGGVVCLRNASVSVLESNFSHNIAAGEAGVLKVDESDITVKKCTFNNNTAGSNGGVFYTYFYPTSYTISTSFFTNNLAGGDGGVMFVGRAGSLLKVTNSTFSCNSATGRGGVVAIAGSTMYINGANMCKKNTAKLGTVVSACKSKVVISNPTLPAKPDPIYSFCSLYGCY